ncbi:hypothetical protein [Demequina iriomotensis]|uniref:hypothetical protein n=1 Tax=Demequina iriomotensis TaxID=1536641 RepID=UPI0007862AC6|nr:hypothetical protein [Demequina iriomotensis]
MIGDSVPWRDELLKSSLRLRRWNTQERWTERTYFLAERDIMMSAYSIRRLIDSAKSSSKLLSKRIPTVQYPLVGRKPMVLDRFDPEQFYDLQKGMRNDLEVGRLCNQVIHSFVFQIYLEEDATTSVVFVSDLDRGKHLHGIPFEVLADLFDYVGREEIIESSGTMIEGEQTFVNTSNHDAVESGRARYADDRRVDTEWIHEEIPPFDEAVLQMVARRMAAVTEQRGDVESG